MVFEGSTAGRAQLSGRLAAADAATALTTARPTVHLNLAELGETDP